MKNCILIFMMMGFNAVMAQDLNFSQFHMLPLLRNPGLSGIYEGDLRINAAHRNQWQSVTVPYKTSALSAEYKIPFIGNDFITLGLQVTHDVAGDLKLKRTQIMPVINYHKSLSGDFDDYISLAFMAGPVQSQFDPSQIKADDQFQNGSYNPLNPTAISLSRTAFSYWDASAGISYNSGFGEDCRYYIGLGIFHFNKPKVGFYTSEKQTELDPKYVLNVGLNIPSSDYNKILFFGDLFKQGGHTAVLGGIFYSIELMSDYDTDDAIALELGAMYRWNDALIPAVKLDYKKLAIGLSYDVNVSKLKTASQLRGGFEITASFKAVMNSRNYYADRVRCTRF